MTVFSFKLFFIAIFIISCNRNQSSDVNNDFITDSSSIPLFTNLLGGFGPKDSLILTAHFSECGEWGGHREKVVVYIKEDRKFYFDYEKYTVDCNSVNPNNGTPIQQLEKKRSSNIKQKEQKSIADYIQRMTKSKINETFPGHAGNTFSIFKSDSTLLISVYGNKIYDVESYTTLLKELKLQ